MLLKNCLYSHSIVTIKHPVLKNRFSHWMTRISHRVLGGLERSAREDKKRERRILREVVQVKHRRSAIQLSAVLGFIKSLSQFLIPKFLLYWTNLDIHYHWYPMWGIIKPHCCCPQWPALEIVYCSLSTSPFSCCCLPQTHYQPMSSFPAIWASLDLLLRCQPMTTQPL